MNCSCPHLFIVHLIYHHLSFLPLPSVLPLSFTSLMPFSLPSALSILFPLLLSLNDSNLCITHSFAKHSMHLHVQMAFLSIFLGSVFDPNLG